jgi:putative ABC transport system ATP-binding protein
MIYLWLIICSHLNYLEENNKECKYENDTCVFSNIYHRTIARSLANEPEILLLDEPTGDLDTKNTVEIMDLLLDINHQQGTTLVMVTHNPDLECYANRVLYVRDGRIYKEAVNNVQARIDLNKYLNYLNTSSS